MSLPSTKQLRYFAALAEHEHFGRAAEASFVSQSAFSNAIRELESTLDVQLVDRTNRQVTITAIGQQVDQQFRRCGIDPVQVIADEDGGPSRRDPLPEPRHDHKKLAFERFSFERRGACRIRQL